MDKYYLVWIHEEEEWYYFKDSFDESKFEDGYVDYEILVEDGIIKEDDWKEDNVGKSLDECYPDTDWE